MRDSCDLSRHMFGSCFAIASRGFARQWRIDTHPRSGNSGAIARRRMGHRLPMRPRQNVPWPRPRHTDVSDMWCFPLPARSGRPLPSPRPYLHPWLTSCIRRWTYMFPFPGSPKLPLQLPYAASLRSSPRRLSTVHATIWTGYFFYIIHVVDCNRLTACACRSSFRCCC